MFSRDSVLLDSSSPKRLTLASEASYIVSLMEARSFLSSIFSSSEIKGGRFTAPLRCITPLIGIYHTALDLRSNTYNQTCQKAKYLNVAAFTAQLGLGVLKAIDKEPSFGGRLHLGLTGILVAILVGGHFWGHRPEVQAAFNLS